MLIAVAIGFLFGFIGSIPVAGPIAVLVFARAVDGRYKSGLYIGLGCAIAEAMYAFLAFWGFATFLADYDFIIPVSRGAAAIILTGLGIGFMRRRSDPDDYSESQDKGGGSFLLGFSITALNPTLIATWAAAATILFSSGLVDLEPSMSVFFGLGACGGIALWYLILLKLVRRYKDRFKMETLNRIIRIMGVFLVGVGFWFAWFFVKYILEGHG